MMVYLWTCFPIFGKYVSVWFFNSLWYIVIASIFRINSDNNQLYKCGNREFENFLSIERSTGNKLV